MKPEQSETEPKRYPSDLTRTQWERLKRLLPPAKPGGRPRPVKPREVLDRIFSIVRGGCGWRTMPKDLPPGSTCSHYFCQWRDDGTWANVNGAPRAQVRPQNKRKKGPGLGIIDGQGVTTTERGGPHGKDPHTKVAGRERHLVVDALGMAVAAAVHPAGTQDRDGAKPVLGKMVGRLPRRKTIPADGISHGGIAAWAKGVGGWVSEPVVRSEGQATFAVLPWRWIVERTIAWLGRDRRLSKDYEGSEEWSESWIYVAMTHLMLRRLEPA
jgi:putative transposase